MLAVKLTDNFDVSIPAELRSAMNLKPGQRFAVIPKGRSISLVPIPEIEELVGIAEGADTSDYRDRRDRT